MTDLNLDEIKQHIKDYAWTDPKDEYDADAHLIKYGRGDLNALVAEVERLSIEAARMKQINEELLQGLQHMQSCGGCAEDSWSCCEGGRRALAALASAKGQRAEKPCNDGDHYFKNDLCKLCLWAREDVIAYRDKIRALKTKED